jgi:hypothetical protein
VEESETLVAEAAGVREGIELEETRQGPGGTVLHTFSVEESGTEWVVNATDGYVTRWARRDLPAGRGEGIGEREAIASVAAEAERLLGADAKDLAWSCSELAEGMRQVAGMPEAGVDSRIGEIEGTLAADGALVIYRQTLKDPHGTAEPPPAVSQEEAIAIAQADLDADDFYPRARLSTHPEGRVWAVTLQDYETTDDIPDEGPRCFLYFIDTETGRIIEVNRAASSGFASEAAPPTPAEQAAERASVPWLPLLGCVAGLGLAALVAVKLSRRGN